VKVTALFYVNMSDYVASIVHFIYIHTGHFIVYDTNVLTRWAV